MARADLTGKRFGDLTVIGLDGVREKYGKKRTYWLCRCDCGKEKVILGNTLVSGLNKSCGCQRYRGSKKTKHGHASGYRHTRTYRSWCHMRQRCLDVNNKDFKFYGGRGIFICERWHGEHGYENFLADMGECPPGLTLDRRDNSKWYSPDNCKWATREEQSRNRRNSIRCTHDGKTLSLMEWAEILGIKYDTLHDWITKRGLTIPECIERKKRLNLQEKPQ